MPEQHKITGQAFDFKSLLESSRLFLESEDVDFITGNLLLAVMGKFMATRTMILLYKESARMHQVYNVKGRSSYVAGDNINLQHLDVSASAHITAEREQNLPEGFIRLIPLRTASKHIGFLCLGERFDKAEFSASDIEFVDALAALAAISISNASLIDRLKTANRKLDRKIYELNTLFDLSKQFNELDEKEQIADILKFTLMGHLFVRKLFFAYRTAADDQKPQCLSANNLSKYPSFEALNQLFEQHQSSDIIATTDLKERPAFIEEEHIQKLFYLRFQNESLALIGLGNKANGTAYDTAEEQLILSMSNLALLSIQKVSLLQQKIEKERMEEELNLAKSIQKGLLPESMPKWEHYEVYGMNKSSQQVGGDYFEVREATDGRWVLAIADVTGKGFPASLLMSNLQAALHTLMQSNTDITEATARLNDTIYNNTPSDKFITFFWGKFDPKTGIFSYVNAGHNPPFLYRKANQGISELSAGGLLLGAMPSMMPYESGQVQLQSGDMIVMFTDGLTEVFDQQEEEFGEARLAEVVVRHAHLSTKDFTENLVKEVMHFSYGVQYDDITSLVLKAK